MECAFTTGYLTHKGCTESGKYRLVIPNKEVRNLFVKKSESGFLMYQEMMEKHWKSFAVHL